MSEHITVTGPHGRHMDIHPAIQSAFPDRYPLVTAAGKPEKSEKSDQGDK